MMDPLVLLAFIPAALALNLTPGADMMFCLGLGLRSGGKAALAAAAGISAGGLVHVTLAGLGLGAAVAALPWLFDAIRWVGVAYLLWLAAGALRRGPARDVTPLAMPAARAFREGLIVNLLNPKVILFVLAFVPQFVNPAQGSVLGQFLICGLVLAVGGFVINGAVGLLAGGLGQRLATSARFTRGLGYASALIFAGLAVRLALLQRS
ncbi:Threonine/homoserine/homoserine lactone efflux protein [Roseovarius litoreus]|jgi:threonine/homoserine/homoserine lactone efflux protein|uniref:Threonine/homoserine/homoserine lactone efflux protein n=1 Tax=Roseovarius litoreus TaxID=1155722 RepID=A0A1M7JA18_9RHOB|nr:LysE family translocator [Roseovarius litoreus]SHM49741.1 Threonine/homoserine/homoserine lactone efflux protein [Roseovarius litoreus]